MQRKNLRSNQSIRCLKRKTAEDNKEVKIKPRGLNRERRSSVTSLHSMACVLPTPASSYDFSEAAVVIAVCVTYQIWGYNLYVIIIANDHILRNRVSRQCLFSIADHVCLCF